MRLDRVGFARSVAMIVALLAQARPAAASTLPFDVARIQDLANANRAMALDAAGGVYVVAIVGGQVQLTVSTNDTAT